MPPIRTAAITKPVKTERTHEENQERFVHISLSPLHAIPTPDTTPRAYIAASRRSDRSLEARVESARRASEIHKRRTGRSLRVTEQDVVNEEMYEEEDDDLPLHYRRLTAHLGTTGSPDFNRRLAAYLTQNVAMRSALGQAINQSYSQTYTNSQLAQPTQQSYIDPSQMNLPQQQLHQQQQQHFMPQHFQNQPHFQPAPSMPPPHFQNRSPTTYRQSPYPMASDASRQTAAASGKHANGSPVEQAIGQHMPDGGGLDLHRTPPAQSVQQNASVQAAHAQSAQRTFSSSSSSSRSNPSTQADASTSQSAIPISPAQHPAQSHPAPFTQDHMAFQQGMPIGSNYNVPLNWNTFMPQNMYSPVFSAAPTGDLQTFFSSNYDHSGSSAASAMVNAQQEKPAQPFYSYNPNSFNKTRNIHPSYDGMSQTLAPNALDGAYDPSTFASPLSSVTEGAATPFPPTYNPTFDLALGGSAMMQHCDSGIGSGAMTPAVADGEWNYYFDSTKWEDTTA